MKKGIKIVSVIAALIMSVSMFACKKPTDEKQDYLDTADRPEIEMPVTPSQVVYPPKPDAAPTEPAAGAVPKTGEYASSQADSAYKIEKNGDTVRISYSDVANWAYVYFPVTDYSAEYGNFKITVKNDPDATGDAGLAEKIAVQAVYYEAYDLGYSPVTVYSGDLINGEQYIIAELAETQITDKTYQPISGESVRNKTIIGFVIFIDSLPSMPTANGSEGVLDILNFEFLKDGDPKLEDRYVKPVAMFADATADDGVTLSAGEDGITVSGTGSVYIPLEKYSSDFAKFTLSLSGTADETVKTGVRYKFGDGEPITSVSSDIALTGEAQDAEYDYSSVRAESADPDIAARYLKYAKVTDIVLILDNASEIVLSEVKFTRTVPQGPFVTDSWTSASSKLQFKWSYGSGNVGIAASFCDDWMDYVTVPVRKGENVRKIIIKLAAPDGLNHLGFAIATTSPNNSENQSKGSFVLRQVATAVDGANTAVSAYGKGTVMEGITETVSYDAATKTYTFTYDFTDMVKDSAGKTFTDYSVNSVLFYMNCNCSNKTAHRFDGEHALYFDSIQFVCKE